jgi:aconitate hydratase
LIILAGKEYGSGSSRDWAAKGPFLQGVQAVIAESFERIHRSNLVGMGILPLQFKNGESAAGLGLTGREIFDISGIGDGVAAGFAQTRQLRVRALREDGTTLEFDALARIDTPQEVLYYRHGGILQFVLRQLLTGKSELKAPAEMSASPQRLSEIPSQDKIVEEGSVQSFPASDVPSYMGGRTIAGAPPPDREARESATEGLSKVDEERRPGIGP